MPQGERTFGEKHRTILRGLLGMNQLVLKKSFRSFFTRKKSFMLLLRKSTLEQHSISRSK